MSERRTPTVGRRGLLAGALAAAAVAPARAAEKKLAAATVIVGGPPDSATGAFAAALAPLLAPALLDGTAVGVQPTGGLDGVTAANAFETRASPDGSTALMVPGTALLAWLAGDPRVHFDAGLWVPALAATAPAVLVGRRGPVPGQPFRFAGAGPTGRDMPALLALELLHAPVVPRFAIRLPAEAEAALREGAADGIVLDGPDVPTRLAALAADGIGPIMSFGDAPAGLAGLRRVPSFDEYAARIAGLRPEGPLLPGYRAAAAAANLATALVLPQLASAGIVALWRTACDAAADAPALRALAATDAVRPVSAPDCVAAVAATVAGETAQLDLHRFLAERYGWRPA